MGFVILLYYSAQEEIEYLIVRALFQVENDELHVFEEADLAEFETQLADIINAERISVYRSDIMRGERLLITIYYSFE